MSPPIFNNNKKLPISVYNISGNWFYEFDLLKFIANMKEKRKKAKNFMKLRNCAISCVPNATENTTHRMKTSE